MKLQIWDTAGEERFRSVTPMYYKNASAIVLVYDCTDEESFNSLPVWVKEIDKFKNQDFQLLVVVSSKSDLVG